GVALLVRRAHALHAGGFDQVLAPVQAEGVESQSDERATLEAAGGRSRGDVPGEAGPFRYHRLAVHLNGLGEGRGEPVAVAVAAGVDGLIHTHVQWRAAGE